MNAISAWNGCAKA